jgi:hypothetical protein
LSSYWQLTVKKKGHKIAYCNNIWLTKAFNMPNNWYSKSKETSFINVSAVILEITTQVSLVVIGSFLLLISNPLGLVEHMFAPGKWPTTDNPILGSAWMVVGLFIYYFFRWRENLPVNHTPKDRE